MPLEKLAFLADIGKASGHTLIKAAVQGLTLPGQSQLSTTAPGAGKVAPNVGGMGGVAGSISALGRSLAGAMPPAGPAIAKGGPTTPPGAHKVQANTPAVSLGSGKGFAGTNPGSANAAGPGEVGPPSSLAAVGQRHLAVADLAASVHRGPDACAPIV